MITIFYGGLKKSLGHGVASRSQSLLSWLRYNTIGDWKCSKSRFMLGEEKEGYARWRVEGGGLSLMQTEPFSKGWKSPGV